MILSRYLLGALLLAGLAGCSGSQSASESAVSPQKSTEGASPVAVDVAALVGLPIDQVRKKLGPPTESRTQKVGIEPTAEQLKATKGEDWINTFEHNRTTLVATFNARTRKVRDLVVIGTDEDEILQKANLSLTASRYIILPVANPQDQREIVGLRVIQK